MKFVSVATTPRSLQWLFVLISISALETGALSDAKDDREFGTLSSNSLGCNLFSLEDCTTASAGECCKCDQHVLPGLNSIETIFRPSSQNMAACTSVCMARGQACIGTRCEADSDGAADCGGEGVQECGVSCDATAPHGVDVQCLCGGDEGGGSLGVQVLKEGEREAGGSRRK
eukprot:CAMPEP_0181293672 /NCGR_PEP_ID=MMETSP1101-20121128/3188_1 /TAXON_ID=46948 /ORGANISM="Rhodomonas abbreviata, Strain Caron Lab Isolate" /LENGTH=172 /DNA_ID=CAMNT_0023398271 /DNA_START=169 /DNA_END=684 /DNA_ORIENTATION=-